MSAKQSFLDSLQARKWGRIGASEWAALRTEFPNRSETCLRGWLRGSDVFIEPPYTGIGVKTLAELEHSLTAFACVYLENIEVRKICRAVVIQAKDRARFAAANVRATPEKRALKEEMVQWMLVWLDDPAMFGAWVKLRKDSIS
jgi:hypothetical protein